MRKDDVYTRDVLVSDFNNVRPAADDEYPRPSVPSQTSVFRTIGNGDGKPKLVAIWKAPKHWQRNMPAQLFNAIKSTARSSGGSSGSSPLGDLAKNLRLERDPTTGEDFLRYEADDVGDE